MSHGRTSSDVFFQTLFKRGVTPMLVLDNVSGYLLSSNPAFAQLLGVPRTEVSDTFWPDEKYAARLIENAQADRVANHLLTLRGASGDIPVLVTADVIGSVTLVQLQDQRVTRLASISETASSAGRRLDAVLAASPVATALVHHANNVVVDVNPAFTRLIPASGETPIGAQTANAWRDPEQLEAFIMQLNRNGYVEAFETALFSRDGAPFPVQLWAQLYEIRGETYRIVQFIDLSEQHAVAAERRAVEAKILEAQRLESLGLLAGGVAHDFNNLLSGILGNADLALFEAGLPAGTRQRLEDIVTAGKHASELTRQLLAYSGKGRFVIEPVNVNHVITEMSQILQASISDNCVVQTNLAADLPSVEGDRSQIQQVLMNLIINASEACEGTSQGTVTITTYTQEVDEDYLARSTYAGAIGPGTAVCIAVSDNGVGMTEETKLQLFEPFYTTKFTGRGLGMAAVLGIVRGHGGAIRVSSELGRGTNVKVLLPVSGDAVVNDPRSEWTPREGVGSVLIVDDDVTVASTAEAILTRFGFAVTCVHSGQAALDWLADNGERCAVVLLDLTMPDMDGEQTYRRLRQLHPDLQVILMSGYNEQEATQAFIGKGLAGFLSKPFLVSDVIDLVQRVLDPPQD